jgi:hypothetical protein
MVSYDTSSGTDTGYDHQVQSGGSYTGIWLSKQTAVQVWTMVGVFVSDFLFHLFWSPDMDLFNGLK